MRVVDLGESVPYHEGMRVMRETIAQVDRDGPTLLILEHAPVLTITRRGRLGAFVSPREVVERDGIEVVEADRGGDVTFHGPGQIVGYPILRLGPTSLGSDVVGYVHDLEAAVVRACVRLGVTDAHATRERDEEGHHLTGVWCDAPRRPSLALPPPRSGGGGQGGGVSAISCGLHDVQHEDAKVCAIGVGITGGVVRHGFALNVSIDLEKYTRHIVPCGLTGRTATSLERVLAKTPTRAVVVSALVDELAALNARHIG